MGQSSVLWWDVTSATTLAVEPNWGSVLSQIHVRVTPTQTTTYTLTLNGSITAQVTVTVLPGAFTPTGSMTGPRTSHTATLLPSGQVLIVGGVDASNYFVLAGAELYDPSAGTFAPTGSMAVARGEHTATLLGNGKVLIAGGYDSDEDSLASAELYDPSAGTFAPTGSMSVGRWAHTATLLDNGKVLVAGGCDARSGMHATPSAELYDPSAGTFAPVGNMSEGRYLHTATRLGNAQVLIAGGFDKQVAPYGGVEVSSADIYDPAARTFTATASMTSERAGHAATLMNDGRVLITGGGRGGATMSASAELYDPAAGAFAATGDMTDARAYHTATLLGNGKVLVAGAGWRTLQGADLYDPVAGAFATTGLMSAARGLHTATLLPSGQVLVAGGSDHDTVFASAELYDSTRDHL
jgi:hypothetical protein